MSRIMTWLVLVFDDHPDKGWFIDPLFDESHAVYEVQKLRISSSSGVRQRHLRFPLEQPLVREQLDTLENLKKDGLFWNFYIIDEITPDVLG